LLPREPSDHTCGRSGAASAGHVCSVGLPRNGRYPPCMTVLSSLAGRHTTLGAREVDHLHRLLGEWQLLSGFAFADLLLLAPVVDRSAFVVLGQVRPYPAQTLYPEDMVGAVLDSRDRPKAAQSIGEKRIVSEGDPEWRDGTP